MLPLHLICMKQLKETSVSLRILVVQMKKTRASEMLAFQAIHDWKG